MEKTLFLKAQIRERTGSKYAEEVRKQGLIPAVVYGHKEEAVAIALNAHNFVEGLHHGHRLIDVKIGKKSQKMLVKDLQYDYLGKNIIHVDLMRVDVTETVRVTVPIEFKGQVSSSQAGAIIEEHVDRLEVECKVADIPENIVVSVKEMEVGDSVHAADIVLPEGVKLVSAPSTLVATCGLVAAAVSAEAVEAEAPAAPEVIGEEEKEEESGESEEADK